MEPSPSLQHRDRDEHRPQVIHYEQVSSIHPDGQLWENNPNIDAALAQLHAVIFAGLRLFFMKIFRTVMRLQSRRKKKCVAAKPCVKNTKSRVQLQTEDITNHRCYLTDSSAVPSISGNIWEYAGNVDKSKLCAGPVDRNRTSHFDGRICSDRQHAGRPVGNRLRRQIGFQKSEVGFKKPFKGL